MSTRTERIQKAWKILDEDKVIKTRRGARKHFKQWLAENESHIAPSEVVGTGIPTSDGFTDYQASEFAPTAEIIDVEEPFVGETKTMFDDASNQIEMNVEDFTETDDFVKDASNNKNSNGAIIAGSGGGGGGDSLSAGTIVAAASGLASDIGNLIVTISSKAGEEFNPFADYATRAINKIDESKAFAGKVKSLQEQDLVLAEQTQRAGNRNMARGIGAHRALDLATHFGGLSARRGIATDYYNRMESINRQEADMLLRQDDVVMSGEERTRERNQKNKDAYYTALSENISSFGETGQNIGRAMNIEKAGKQGVALASQGKYGDYSEWIDEIFNY